jgi:GrpB-like predicted nucleotidyltransferase (UPF0157 family)
MKITIFPYDPNWSNAFEQEKTRLTDALDGHIIDIQHIGSTSIPGLGAKPIIDIMIAVRMLEEADRFCIQPIVALGYEYVKAFERETPMRRFFRKDDARGVRTHHIHMVEIDSDWWDLHLLFRDYLRSHPEACRDYETHKRQLAEREWNVSNDYAEAKTEFILRMLEQARAWQESARLSTTEKEA